MSGRSKPSEDGRETRWGKLASPLQYLSLVVSHWTEKISVTALLTQTFWKSKQQKLLVMKVRVRFCMYCRYCSKWSYITSLNFLLTLQYQENTYWGASHIFASDMHGDAQILMPEVCMSLGQMLIQRFGWVGSRCSYLFLPPAAFPTLPALLSCQCCLLLWNYEIWLPHVMLSGLNRAIIKCATHYQMCHPLWYMWQEAMSFTALKLWQFYPVRKKRPNN